MSLELWSVYDVTIRWKFWKRNSAADVNQTYIFDAKHHARLLFSSAVDYDESECFIVDVKMRNATQAKT